MAKALAQTPAAPAQAAAASSSAVVQPLASDGLPVPHKRAVWNQAEVLKFIAVWNESGSIQEVMVKMNRSLAACYSMAKQCRKNGVVLKVLGRAAGIDWSSVKSALPAVDVK